MKSSTSDGQQQNTADLKETERSDTECTKKSIKKYHEICVFLALRILKVNYMNVNTDMNPLIGRTDLNPRPGSE